MSVGWPTAVHLDVFGHAIRQCFGETPYQVGSSLNGKGWRDVDVVVMLPETKMQAFFGPGSWSDCNWRWAIMCAAFSALGKEMTGLPIDFKIQPIKEANERHKGKPRSALGMQLAQPEEFWDEAIQELMKDANTTA